MNLKSKLPPRFQKYASFGIIPKLFLLPFATATVLGMKLLRPLVMIQVHKVHDWRIGHFATNTELTRLNDIVQNENTRRKTVTIYYWKQDFFKPVFDQVLAERTSIYYGTLGLAFKSFFITHCWDEYDVVKQPSRQIGTSQT